MIQVKITNYFSEELKYDHDHHNRFYNFDINDERKRDQVQKNDQKK